MEKAAGNPGRLAKAASVVVISLCVILFLLYRSLSGEIAGGKSWQSGLGTEPAGSGERIPGAEAAGDLSGTERAGSLSGGEPGKDMEDSRSGTGLRAGQSGLPDEDKQQEREEAQRYRDFLERLEAVKNIRETAEYGFIVIEEQIFPFTMEGGREVSLVPAIDRESRRLVLFFVGQEDEIAFRTEQLEANQPIPGSWKLGTREVAAVSFPDLDGDGLNDVVLVALCNTREDGTGMTAKVGDVLFQRQGGFYQDWRLSDRINRFGMNKSVKMILSFVREGDFAGVFYRAAAMKDLKEHGFTVDERHSFRQSFEKLGDLLVVPGYYRMAEYHICMVCLVNEQGNLVWSGQPMGEFENLYEILEIDSQDIDGDGLKDLTVLARYTSDAPDGSMITEKDYTIYYQRTGGFLEDTELKSRYQCTEDTVMDELVELARSYWGWGTEND